MSEKRVVNREVSAKADIKAGLRRGLRIALVPVTGMLVGIAWNHYWQRQGIPSEVRVIYTCGIYSIQSFVTLLPLYNSPSGRTFLQFLSFVAMGTFAPEVASAMFQPLPLQEPVCPTPTPDMGVQA